jgi:hypothetical protein
MWGPGRVVVATELALGAAGAVYFARQPPGAEAARNVFLCLAVIAGVGTAIALGYGRMRLREAAFVSSANAAIRAVASRVGLDQVSEPPTAIRAGHGAPQFVEARGTVRGVRVSLFVDQTRADEMKMMLLFPGAAPREEAVAALESLARRVRHDRGLMLELRPASWSFASVEPGVEIDVSRIVAVIEGVADALASSTWP